jgi:hypothetical protein
MYFKGGNWDWNHLIGHKVVGSYTTIQVLKGWALQTNFGTPPYIH